MDYRIPTSEPMDAPAELANRRAQPAPDGIAWRLFLTCWIVYCVHFSSNIVREIYLAVALGDHLSFRVDEYANMHPDLFEKPGYGWHIGNNPGISLVAAVPYALARPVIDPVVARVQARRKQAGMNEPPTYDSPWPLVRKFYAESWRRGLDVKLGLAAMVMQFFCMAPSSAAGVVLIYYVLRGLIESPRRALLLSLLYAFGTPVFFRTGFLNHNMAMGHLVFAGFLALWNPRGQFGQAWNRRTLFAGFTAGTAVLFDYSGVVYLFSLFFYCLACVHQQQQKWSEVAKQGALFVCGTLPPILMLWYYQWRSFGHPFYPGQHWMPPVEWIELGYQGYGRPQLELLYLLAFDHRFGLFVVCPLFVFSLVLLFHPARRMLCWRELLMMLGSSLALWIFFSGSNYTRLQFNTGLRYMAPVIPFLFVPAALLLNRIRPGYLAGIALISVTLSWCLAMHRDVETGPGILNPVMHVFLGGFQLPLLTALSRLSPFANFFEHGASPLPLFLFTAALIAIIWTFRINGHRYHGPATVDG